MSSLCTQFHIHAESKDTRTRIMTSVGSVCNGCYSRTAKNERVVLGTRADQMSVFCMSCWDTAEFTCSICAASPATSDVVGCDTCGQWFHKDCTLATAASNAQFENCSGHWECHDCKAESCAHVPSLSVQKEYQSMFQDKVKTMNVKYEKRLTNPESKHRKQLREAAAAADEKERQQNQLDVSAMHSQHAAEIASLKSRHEDLLKMTIQEKVKTMSDKYETRLTNLESKHRKQLREAAAATDEKRCQRNQLIVSAIHSQHTSEIDSLKSRHDDLLKMATECCETKICTLRGQHEGAIAALREEFRVKLERVKVKVAAKIKQNKAEACQEMVRLGQLANKRKRDRDKMVDEVTRLANTVNHLAKRMRGQ